MSLFGHYIDSVTASAAPRRRTRRSRAGTLVLFLVAGALAYFGWRML